MELRHLDTLLTIAEEGSFTAAADALATVQSNVSEHVRQLEEELQAQLVIRGRRGAQPTEFGNVVLERARRIRRELDAMRTDVRMLQGLEAGSSAFGIVGTASRWVVPDVVADLRDRAPGVRLRINEGATPRLIADVIAGELAQAIVTEPVNNPRCVVEPLLRDALVGVVPSAVSLPAEPVPLDVVAAVGLVLPPVGNPLRQEVDAAARNQGLTIDVRVEIEGIRLIADLVAAGAGASILRETAVPPELQGVKTVRIANIPQRRLALVNARDAHLSFADRAVRESLVRVFRRRAEHRV